MTPKKIAFQFHLWLGLLSGLIIVIIAITGGILAFEKELKHFFHSERYSIQNEGVNPLPIQELKSKAESVLPDNLKMSRVTIPQESDQTYMFRTLKIDNDALTFWGSYIYYYRVYINPYTGEIVSVENAKNDFFEIVLNLHRRLLLGENIGKNITRYTCIAFIIILISGIMIWLPKKVNRKSLKGVLLIKKTSNWKRMNYDFHRVLGFYSTFPLILILYSALVWNLKDSEDWFRKLMNSKGVSEKKAKSTVPAEGTPENIKILNQVWDTIKQQQGEKKASALINFPKTEEGTIYTQITYDNKQYKNDKMYIDQYSGVVLKKQLFLNPQKSFGVSLQEKNYDLHTGSLFGIFGRILYFLTSLIIVSLPITGTIIYFNRTAKKKIKK